MKIRSLFALVLATSALSTATRAQIHPLDLPLTATCPQLFSVDFNNDGVRELLGWTYDGRTSGRIELATWQMLPHGRLHRAQPSFSELRSLQSVDLWTEGEPHFLIVGSPRVSSTTSPSIQSIAGLDGEVVFERPVAILNGPERAVILESRSPIDFDFAVSSAGELQVYRSAISEPTWSMIIAGLAKALGRADVDGDGIDELLVGTSPISARNAITGELVWTGTTNGATHFATGNLDGDDGAELIVFGGNSGIAIYGGDPFVLKGSWDGGFVQGFTIHDADDDGQDELLIAEFEGGLHAINAQGMITRNLFAGRNLACLAVHPFSPEEGERLVAAASGYAQSTAFIVSSLDPKPTDEPAVKPLAEGPFSKIELTEFLPDELSIAHSFFHPFGIGNFPRASGVRVVSAPTGRVLYESEPWQRLVMDFAIGGPTLGGESKTLWLAGARYPPYEHTWLQAIDGSDFSPLQGRVFAELGDRDAQSVFILPSVSGSQELILLLTTGTNGPQLEFLAHFIDPETLTIVGSPLSFGNVFELAAQLVDIDGVGQPELVTRTYDAITARSLPTGTLLWEIPTASFGLAYAINTAHNPALLAYRQDSAMVLRNLRTAELVDTIELPFTVEAIGGGNVDPDLLLLATENRLWEYSIGARTLTPAQREIGFGVGHKGNIQAATVDETPMLLMGSTSGLWTYGTPAAKRIFRNSFEPTPPPGADL